MTKLREHSAALADCVDALAQALREALPSYGVDVAIDASDMAAYANGQRFLYNHGPERKAYSDPDASWGHRSAVSTRKGGGFYGVQAAPGRLHADGPAARVAGRDGAPERVLVCRPASRRPPRSRVQARDVRDG